MKIAVAGAGYVGLSLGTLLSVKNDVYILDVVHEKVEKINNRICPIEDEYIENYFKKKIKLTATLDYKEAWRLAWDKASVKERKKLFALPNWNNKVFKEITGIDAEKEINK